MSISKITPDDPRLTAYALGELEGDERAAMEAALRDDPALQAAVDEIRATVAQLESALATEPMVTEASELSHAAIIAGHDPAKLDGGPLAKVIRFPQLYYLVGGLAAAGFAVLLALRPPAGQPGPKSVNEVAQAKDATAKSVKMAVSIADLQAPATARAPVALPPVPEPKPMPSAMPVPVADAGAYAGLLAQAETARQQVMQERQARIEAFVPSGPGSALGSSATTKATAPRAELAPMTYAANAPTAAYGGGPRDIGAMKLSRFGVAANAGKDDTLQGAVITGGVEMKVAAAPANPPAMNTEAYAYRRDNDFVSAAGTPQSTFAVDVDTAGYANVRRFLRNGQRPPEDAVRVEELVNNFPYRYAPPTGDVPFAASLEVADAPWAPTHRLVRIGLKGREVSTGSRPAANLVFLIDVSGSMDEPNKLPLVKEALRLLVGRLRPDDRVAIVVYAGESGLALPSTPVAKSAEIVAALDALTPGGTTNGAMGIQLAYDIAKANFVAGGVNRVILCTDGDFNVGVTSEGGLTRLIEEKAKSGVFLTALGFGMGNYKDATLEQLADKGNGNYGYIDTRREAEKLLVEQVNGTLVTIAKDVKVQVEFNPAQVASYRLIGYENRLLRPEDFNNDAVDAGEIGAGHTVTALYEIVPVGQASAAATVDPLKYQNRGAESGDRHSPELLTVSIRYKDPSGEVSRKLEFPLTDHGARFAAASADFKFAAAVAEFGMILRNSPHKGAATLQDVLTWAGAGLDGDAGGYRSEFLDLVRQAATLQ